MSLHSIPKTLMCESKNRPRVPYFQLFAKISGRFYCISSSHLEDWAILSATKESPSEDLVLLLNFHSACQRLDPVLQIRFCDTFLHHILLVRVDLIKHALEVVDQMT